MAGRHERVEQDQIHDVILRPNGVPIDDAGLAQLRNISNVDGLDVRAFHFTQMRVDDRVSDVLLVGVDDFENQQVNVVQLNEGHTPTPATRPLEGLSEPQNARSGRLDPATGSTITVRSAGGAFSELNVTGKGSTVYYSNAVIDSEPVLYVPLDAVWALAGHQVITQVEFTVADRDDAAVATTTDAVRAGLAALEPDVQYRTLPEIRPEGEWPEEDEFNNFLVLFWVIAGVSLVSALVLVATTMTTVVREQTKEIGIMKALGGNRRAIAVNYTTSALLLGGVGTTIGIAVGLPLSNLLAGFLGTQLIGADPGWQFSWFAFALSLAVGVGGTVIASLPALARGTRIPVREGIGTHGITGGYGRAALDRGLGHLGRLPRATQMGLRSAVRRKGRSVATAIQIALAVGTMLGFTAMVITLIEVSEQSGMAEGGDIQVWTTGSGRVLDDEAVSMVAELDGVDRVQPIVGADALIADTDTFAWGLPADPIYRHDLAEGRWFTDTENAAQAQVAVVGPALANIHDIELGDSIRIETADGPLDVEVVGLDTTMVDDGLAAFVPIDTLKAVRRIAEPTWFWLTTTSSEPTDIDRVASDKRVELSREGYAFDYEVRHVTLEADRSTDQTVIAIILSLGIPVVAIGMIGLVSTMTTSIIERSRETGVLRSIGARARDLRRIFRAEALALVVVGWLAGIGVGFIVGQIILRAMNDAFNVSFTLRYPAWPVAVALVVTVVVALVALHWPLRRVSTLSPSDALRYE